MSKTNLCNKFCRKPFEHFEVHPNGNVSLCCYSWLPYYAGQLSENTSITEVFNSNTVKTIRKSIHDGTFKYCNHKLCPHIQNNSLPDKTEVEGSRMKAIVENEIVDGLSPDFYNLCYDESCNLSCPSCRRNKINFNYGQGYDQRKKIQDIIIRDIFETPHNRNCTVNITGSGDPFGSKLFRELLFNIDGKNFPQLNINLQTNGVMFTEKYWNKMHKIHNNINTVIVSYDAGTEGTYRVTRRGGDWNQLQDNMKFLSGLRSSELINELRIDVVVQKINYKEMPLIVDIGKRLNVDVVYFSQLVNWGTYSKDEFDKRTVWEIDHPEYNEFIKTICDCRLEDPIVDLGNLTEYKTSYVAPPLTKLDEHTPYRQYTFTDIQQARDLVHKKNYNAYIDNSTNKIIYKLSLTDDDTILDIGSGLGHIAKNLSSIVKKVYCCDINEQYLELAASNCEGTENVSCHMVTSDQYPLNFLPDNSINKAYAHSVMVHNSTKIIIAYLREINRVLKPGGIFYTTYCTKNFNNAERSGTIESNKDDIDATIESLNYDIVYNVPYTNKNVSGVALMIKKL